MFPKPSVRIGKVQWRVILEDADKIRRVVVVAASTKSSAQRKARAMWDTHSFVYDCSPVSGFDPNWFDVKWSDDQ